MSRYTRLIYQLLIFTTPIVNGIVFVNSMPTDVAKILLNQYAISSGVVSALIVYFLHLNVSENKKRLYLSLPLILAIVYSVAIGDIHLITLYSCSVILLEYLTTQSYREHRVKLIAINFFINILIFYGGIMHIILARIAYSLIVFSHYLFSGRETIRLEIGNGLTVIIKSNFVYFGTLAILPIIEHKNVQILYTVVQIGLSYALKIYDFQLRFYQELEKKERHFLIIFGLLPLPIMLILQASPMLLVLYVASFVSLIRLEKIF